MSTPQDQRLPPAQPAARRAVDDVAWLDAWLAHCRESWMRMQMLRDRAHDGRANS